MSLIQKLWQRGRSLFPIESFRFDRPLVVLQSDDWGRAGLRDREGLEQLRTAGLTLGERAYDFYSLETAEDLAALRDLLSRHLDSSGRAACIGMNFIVANLDFAKMKSGGFRSIHLRALANGLPDGWQRPGLFEAYREGIAEGVFRAALHGSTHFCRAAVERHLASGAENASLLRTLWQAGLPYIHWRMPWIGYEFWDPEQAADERFLPFAAQRDLIGQSLGMFARMFANLPRSACAPGYRANDDTHKSWAQHGIRVAQNGPGDPLPPHFDRYGILNLSRTVEFEPATDSSFSLQECVRLAEDCFARGVPAIVSVHSINFHSSVKDFRGRTVELLDEFLCALEARRPDLLYVLDEDIYELVSNGRYEAAQGRVRVNVVKKRFTRAQIARPAAS